MLTDLDQAFDEFLEQREYDKAEDALFSMIRIAFRAGWIAAGGDPTEDQKIIPLMCAGVPCRRST